jgi:hypothetical protein
MDGRKLLNAECSRKFLGKRKNFTVSPSLGPPESALKYQVNKSNQIVNDEVNESVKPRLPRRVLAFLIDFEGHGFLLNLPLLIIVQNTGHHTSQGRK